MVRDVPLGGRDFQVWFGVLGPRGGQGRTFEVACSEVVLPPLRARPEPGPGPPEPPRLVLRRGHTGDQDLYRWWRAERDRAPRRVQVVAVDALDERREPVTRWEFTGCRIVTLEYSPLDALGSGVLTETVGVEFDDVVQRPLRS